MTLCWYVFNGIVRQINICCNIHITFNSRLTYNNNIKCLICGFNKMFRSSKFLFREHVFRRNKDREKGFWLVLIFVSHQYHKMFNWSCFLDFYWLSLKINHWYTKRFNKLVNWDLEVNLDLWSHQYSYYFSYC